MEIRTTIARPTFRSQYRFVVYKKMVGCDFFSKLNLYGTLDNIYETIHLNAMFKLFLHGFNI